jgi:hypothetical protein
LLKKIILHYFFLIIKDKIRGNGDQIGNVLFYSFLIQLDDDFMRFNNILIMYYLNGQSPVKKLGQAEFFTQRILIVQFKTIDFFFFEDIKDILGQLKKNIYYIIVKICYSSDGDKIIGLKKNIGIVMFHH